MKYGRRHMGTWPLTRCGAKGEQKPETMLRFRSCLPGRWRQQELGIDSEAVKHGNSEYGPRNQTVRFKLCLYSSVAVNL